VHFNLKDIITLSIAAVGAVLGTINTWHSLDQRRVRLRVVPKLAWIVAENGKTRSQVCCIEVINLSSFPLSVAETGFTLKGEKNRLAVIDLFTGDGQPFARTVEPRRGVTAYFHLALLTSNIDKAYVRTECGEVAYGSSPALKQIREAARD